MADDDTIWSNLFLFVDSDGDGKVTTDDMKKVCCFKLKRSSREKKKLKNDNRNVFRYGVHV